MIGRGKIPEAVREAAQKAGTLVTATLAVAVAALLVACCALVMAFKARAA